MAKIQRGFSLRPEFTEIMGNVRFVLVGTTHAGNVGAVARVMKNAGLSKMVLLDCVDAGPETEAFARASGAYSIVEAAESRATLEEALQGDIMTVATSGRLGGKRLYAGTPDQIVPELLNAAHTGSVSVVFGRESRGLTNDEMKLCTHHLIIPTSSEFASMNVSHAAAIIGYEIFGRCARAQGFQARTLKPASVEVKEAMFAHIEEALTKAGFLDPENPLRMMRDVRRILNSAQLDDRDAKIVRGMFRKIGNMIRISRQRSRISPEDA